MDKYMLAIALDTPEVVQNVLVKLWARLWSYNSSLLCSFVIELYLRAYRTARNKALAYFAALSSIWGGGKHAHILLYGGRILGT